MAGTDPTQTAIRDWLATTDAQNQIAGIAKSICRNLNHSAQAGLSTRIILDLEPNPVEAVRSELNLLILEKAGPLAQLMAHSPDRLSAYLKQAFWNRWHGRRCTPDGNPSTYLYKKAATVLRKARGFVTEVRRHAGIFYGRIPAGVRIGPVTDEQIGAVAFPEHMVDLRHLDEVVRRQNLVLLASHFHDALSGLWKADTVLVPIRTLVRWIGIHVDLSPPRRLESSEEHDPVDGLAAEEHGGQPPPDPAALNIWARCLAARLAPKCALALYLHHGLGQELKHVAKAMGYRSPSGPAYALKGALAELESFARDRPGLGKEDFDPEAWDIFWNALMADLKNRVPDPLD